MDNVSIHKFRKCCVNSIEAAGAKTLYLAPYSPDLNLIELMFSVYKAGLKCLLSKVMAGKQRITRNYTRKSPKLFWEM
jgi:transposase